MPGLDCLDLGWTVPWPWCCTGMGLMACRSPLCSLELGLCLLLLLLFYLVKRKEFTATTAAAAAAAATTAYIQPLEWTSRVDMGSGSG